MDCGKMAESADGEEVPLSTGFPVLHREGRSLDCGGCRSDQSPSLPVEFHNFSLAASTTSDRHQ